MHYLVEESDLLIVQASAQYLETLGVEPPLGSNVLRGTQKLKIMLTLNPKTVNPELDATTHAAYLQVVYNHQDVITSSLADLVEPARVEPCVIQTIGSPINLPPIRLSDIHLQFMRKEVGEMITHGLVTVGSGPWAAPAFAVPKPRSTKLHLVVNYKGTKSQTVQDSTPLPRVDDIVRVVGKNTKFFKLDLKSGF